MSCPHPLDALRRADPRNAPGFMNAVDACAALEQQILASDPSVAASRRKARPRIRRRRITLIAVTGAIVLLGCAAAQGGIRFPGLMNLEPIPTPPPADHPVEFQAHGFMDWQQYHDEYVAWTRKIELPRGAAWRGCDPQGRVPDADGRTYSFYTGTGARDAIWEGMGHWAIEWGAAARAGNGERAAKAQAWVVHLRALLPTGNDGTRDAMDRQTARILDAAIAAALKGDVEKLSHLDLLVGATLPYETPPPLRGR